MQKISKRRIIQTQGLLGISLSFFSILLFCTACYEPIEGCLDIKSSNYEVSADRACDSCCVFPNFNLNIDQVFGGEDFSLGDTLINDVGNELVLTDYYIILSDFRLENSGVVYTVDDSTQVNCGMTSGTENYEVNDLIYISNSSSFTTIGTWKDPGQFEGINFLIGLSDCYHDAGIDDIQSDSKIADIDTLYSTGLGFKTMSFEFSDSITIDFIGKQGTIVASKSTNTSNVAGSAFSLDLDIDFGVWFSGVDLTESNELTKAKLIQNAIEAIVISQ